MSTAKNRITLLSGPKTVEKLRADLVPSLKELEALKKEDEADRAKLAKANTCPYDSPEYRRKYVPLDWIQAWVKKRDMEAPPLEKSIRQREETMSGLMRSEQLAEAQVHEIEGVMAFRRRRAGELRSKRKAKADEEALEKARLESFSKRLGDPNVLEDFIRFQCGQVRECLRQKGVALTWLDQANEGQKGGTPTYRLASVKTLAAAYGQLCREVGYPSTKGFEEGFVEVIRKAGIRSVLEIGPSTRGLVHILSESGFAEKAALELNSIDVFDEHGDVESFRRQGINHVVGDAEKCGKIFRKRRFDMILAVGVLSPGGMGVNCPGDYDGAVGKSHKIAAAACSLLSDNPHSLFVASSINGTMTLIRQDLERGCEIAYWQRPPYETRDADNLTLYRMDSRELRSNTRFFRAFYEANSAAIGYAQSVISQSTDLTIMKRRASNGM